LYICFVVFLQGIDSVSDYAITFHYIPPDKMYVLEFAVYHLRAYGVIEGLQSLNGVPMTERPNQTTTLGVTSTAPTTAKTKPISPSAQPAKNSTSNAQLARTTTRPANVKNNTVKRDSS
jgi:hypothetical protein